MSEPKFTPGPWIVEHVAHDIEISSRTDAGHLSVAWIHMGFERDPELDEACVADACLIAAAPLMYRDLARCVAALKIARTVLLEAGGDPMPSLDAQIAEAEETLAKAVQA